ncbi:MAG: hypothetical protein M3Z10_10220 [Gemmatimonadota bacterium]|nr:hypothetical protein [Gemmatimonadota bacterium]
MTADVAAAREEVARTRAHISDTIDEIGTRITAPVHAVKDRLDIVQLVRDHPWPALAAAIGAGVLVSASGADAKAASIAKAKAVDAGAATVRAARGLPDNARGAAHGAARAAGSYVDGLAGTLLLAVIRRLSEPAPAPDAAPPS